MTTSSSAANLLSRRQRRYFANHLIFDADIIDIERSAERQHDEARHIFLDSIQKRFPQIARHIQNSWQDQRVESQREGTSFEAVGGYTAQNYYVWTARLRNESRDVPGRFWEMSIALGRGAEPGSGAIGVRLTREDPKPGILETTASIPRVIRQFSERLELKGDGLLLKPRYMHVFDSNRVMQGQIVDLIQKPTRRRPIMLFCAAPSNERDRYIPLQPLAESLAGLAHLVVVSRPTALSMLNAIDFRGQIETGDLLCLRPGYSENETVESNPVINLRRAPRQHDLTEALRRISQQASLARPDFEQAVPSFIEIKSLLQGSKRRASIVRIEPPAPQADREAVPAPVPAAPSIIAAPEAAPVISPAAPVANVQPEAELAVRLSQLEAAHLTLQQAHAEGQQEVVTGRDQLRHAQQEIANLTELLQVGDSERHELATRLAEEQARARAVTVERDVAQSEATGLRAQVEEKAKALGVLKGQLYPDYEEFPQWAEVYLPHVVFSRAALKGPAEARYYDPAKFYQSLLLLNQYREMVLYREANPGLLEAFNTSTAKLGLEWGRSARPQTLSSGKSKDYTVEIPGVGPLLMDRHIRSRTTTREDRYTLCIYHHGELVKGDKVAVGVLPFHIG